MARSRVNFAVDSAYAAVISPVTREFASETTSIRTASTATNELQAPAVIPRDRDATGLLLLRMAGEWSQTAAAFTEAPRTPRLRPALSSYVSVAHSGEGGPDEFEPFKP